MGRTSERVTFPGALGSRIVARLDRPTDEPFGYALFAHCFTCSKDLKAINWISTTLAERGIAVLRFDFTGLGESEGEFAETNFSTNLRDLERAADWLRANNRAPRLLIGHSLGGAAVLAAAGQIPECRAVATIAAPSDTSHLAEQLVSRSPALADGAGDVEIQLGGQSVTVRKQLIDDLGRQSLGQRIAKLNRPLMVFHSPTDETVDVSHARRIFEQANHPKSFVSLGDADHLLLKDRRDAIFVADVLSAWVSRYIR